MKIKKKSMKRIFVFRKEDQNNEIIRERDIDK